MPTLSSEPHPTAGRGLRGWLAAIGTGLLGLIRAGVSARAEAVIPARSMQRDR